MPIRSGAPYGLVDSREDSAQLAHTTAGYEFSEQDQQELRTTKRSWVHVRPRDTPELGYEPDDGFEARPEQRRRAMGLALH